MVWQLHMKESGGEWRLVDSFASVTTAALRIREIEGYPVSGVFFDILERRAHSNRNLRFHPPENSRRRQEPDFGF